MKLLIKIFLSLTAVISFSAIVYFSYLYLYIQYDEELSFYAAENVIVINDIFTTSYLVKSDSYYVAIDCNFNEDILWRAFYYNGIKPSQVRAVFLTHSDVDHTNGLDVFSSADVYISKKEIDMINGGSQRFGFIPFLTNSLEKDDVITLADNDSLFIGGIKIKCILLPGHTPGSMGYIVNDIYLFTGDAFRIKNGKLNVPYKKLLAMDVDEMKRSLKKLTMLKGIKYIFSAHSGFSSDFEFAISDWR